MEWFWVGLITTLGVVTAVFGVIGMVLAVIFVSIIIHDKFFCK